MRAIWLKASGPKPFASCREAAARVLLLSPRQGYTSTKHLACALVRTLVTWWPLVWFVLLAIFSFISLHLSSRHSQAKLSQPLFDDGEDHGAPFDPRALLYWSGNGHATSNAAKQ